MKKEAETVRTLGAFVSPLRDHSSTSGGASIEVALASSTNGSLMMLMTKPEVLFLMLLVVSLSPPAGASRQETATTGGQLVIFLTVRRQGREGQIRDVSSDSPFRTNCIQISGQGNDDSRLRIGY